jgi:hypothetical protein
MMTITVNHNVHFLGLDRRIARSTLQVNTASTLCKKLRGLQARSLTTTRSIAKARRRLHDSMPIRQHTVRPNGRDRLKTVATDARHRHQHQRHDHRHRVSPIALGNSGWLRQFRACKNYRTRLARTRAR